MAAPTLNSITDFPGLLTYLEDVLDWPIDEASFEQATFDYTAGELGLKEDVVGGAIEIKQLRPLATNQPWGVFFLNLPHKKLPQTIVRNILGRLTIKTRASANSATRPAFLKSDLLFITSTGHGEDRRLAFAHFQDDPAGGNAATLKLLGWDANDTQRRAALSDATMKAQLHWPDNPADTNAWRQQWAGAFTRADTRTVVRDSKAMAKALAALARRIRARAGELIEAQTADGSLVKLHAAFKEALIHDLTPAGFADTYAQTIAYGLLSTAISRASGALTQDDMTANVAGTSPFLKEMLGQFIEAGGKKAGKAALDFDELGVGEVVDLLRDADMDAVLADFDRKNPDEDPVIHFYELFLKEYDAEQKVKRGVFYTPRPVVGFIVRSVDEVLRTEFHLADGLASTATWGEVIAASAARGDEKPITLPIGAALTDPFVRILDPATGTGTFLVECVDLIHKTMLAKWQAEKRKPDEIKALWNAYVPNHLLPRLTGFELMMAPYAIAHVKLGLKLSDTGYTFGSDARAQIYLTNALEPAQDLDMQLAFMSEALAHEAKAANEAKETRFTVVIGNPPYAGNSANMSMYAQSLVTRYRSINGKSLGERKIWVQNDYAKFFGFAQIAAEKAGIGIIAYITDNSFTDGPTFRGVRHSLQSTYSRHLILDLGGKSTVLRDDDTDQNVFDIQQGVSIFLGLHDLGDVSTYKKRIRGSRLSKYGRVSQATMQSLVNEIGNPRSEFFDFFADPPVELEAEYKIFQKLSDVFILICTGVQTSRDHIAIDFSEADLINTISDFADPKMTDDEVRSQYFAPPKQGGPLPGDTRQWSLSEARKKIFKDQSWKKAIRGITYRPFDHRAFCAAELLSDWPRPELAGAMALPCNVALMLVRRTENDGFYNYVFASASALSNHALSSKDGSYGLPLLVPNGVISSEPRPNFASAFASRIATLTGLTWDDCVIAPKPTQTAMFATRRERGEPGLSLGPRDLFDWIYAVLHSPAYRSRYADYLKSDFARVPLPGSAALFEALVPIGTRLVALHLLDATAAPDLADPKPVRFVGSGEPRVAAKPEFKAGRVYINPSCWFQDVPERAWNFHIGGYQPAQKWLKDRAAKGGKKASDGRVLTPEDIIHYRRMITAMDATIDIMAEIDTVIDEHGGWPAAFKGMTDEAAA